MKKFEKIYRNIISQSSNPPIKSLSHLGLQILKQNWAKVKFKCNVYKQKQDPTTKKYYKAKYNLKLKPYMKFDKYSKNYFHYVSINGDDFWKDEQTSLFGNNIKMYPIELTFEYSSMKHYPTYLSSINYDSIKNVTTLVFNIQYSLELSWTNYIYGSITMIVPGNILNPTAEKINFNCKDFDNYLKSKLPKEWFFKPYTEDDWFISNLHTEYENDTVIVVIDRVTIKAYGDGYSYSDDYVYEANADGFFKLVDGYYSGSYAGRQNEKLGDAIQNALYYYSTKFGRNRPTKLIVRIKGQAD